ncbi:VIP36-like protein [Anguilla rostrata]|uniref:L-type lectin-like domain-containing protein n=1 Tax=Anguilla anguilla TaxID=7936 RepID=A0A9D3M545_ANGAN|nr:VIP36-like protein [Anguilla anguilla]KAG5840970.1 hypothetical protein ANANG_G00194580 [Anguilla anguilla]
MAATMTKKDLVWSSTLFSDTVYCCGMFSQIRWVFFFLFFTASQCWSDEGYEREEFLKREYSLMKPYQGLGSSSSSHWDLLGTAMITTEHVRLTPDLQSRQGAVWSRIPCYLRHWELQIHFRIHGQGKKNLNGDGLAVWFTKERMQIGPVFGNMDLFTGLGLFLDTYPNDNKHQERVFPYVSAMVGNGSVKYDHEHDGRPTELGGCTAILRNVDHDTFILVRYVQHRLTVMTNIDGKQEWRDCLDRPGVHLPLGYYFGASAITGDLSDNHDLISLKLYQLTVPHSEQEEEEEFTVPSVDNMVVRSVKVEDEGMSGVTLFFTILFSVLGCFVLGVISIVLYSRWKENRRKRFY